MSMPKSEKHKHHYIPVKREKLANGEHRQVFECVDCSKPLTYNYDESKDKLYSHINYDGGK